MKFLRHWHFNDIMALLTKQALSNRASGRPERILPLHLVRIVFLAAETAEDHEAVLHETAVLAACAVLYVLHTPIPPLLNVIKAQCLLTPDLY